MDTEFELLVLLILYRFIFPRSVLAVVSFLRIFLFRSIYPEIAAYFQNTFY